MGWDPGKSLIRRAIDGPRHQRAAAAFLDAPRGSFRGRTVVEKAENGRPTT